MRIAGVVLVIALAGCAVLKNTPQQDYVWELGRVCDRQVSFWKMDTVRADAKPYCQWLQERPADK